MTTTATEIVRSAIANTRLVVKPEATQSYWDGILAMRAGLSNSAMGSIVADVTPEQLDKLISLANWEAYEHASIQAPAVGYVTSDVPGCEMGMAQLADLPADTEVTLDDSKKTGFLSAVVSADCARTPVDEIVLLVGPGDDGDVVWTFFPGLPVAPSDFTGEEQGLSHGSVITASEAIKLGFDLAKIG